MPCWSRRCLPRSCSVAAASRTARTCGASARARRPARPLGDDVAPTRHGRESTLEPKTFVQYYLEAAAGDPSGAMERVKDFLSPSAAAKLRAPLPDIRVVHLVEDPLVNPGSDAVTLRAQTIGSLGHNGTLDPVSDGRTIEYKLTVGYISGKNGLFVTNAPSVLLISDSALNAFYERRNLYFWNLEQTGLVPDLRYLSKDLPSEQAPNEILKWLIEGPSQLLEGTVVELPEGTALDGNVPAVSDDTLQINLSGQSVQPADDPDALDRLRRQLMWSLRPNLPRTLKLRVGSQDQHSYEGNEYLTSNLAYSLASRPERFLIYNGQVRRMSRFANPTEPVPVLRPEANRNIRAAALAAAGDRRFAALVVDAGARQELRVAAAPYGEQAELARVSLPGGSTGQPVWAITSEDPHIPAVGLITVGGRLYSFASDGSPVAAVAVPGASSGITAVAVAPDGRRIALAAGGRVFIASLATNGDGVQVRQSRHILTSPLRQGDRARLEQRDLADRRRRPRGPQPGGDLRGDARRHAGLGPARRHRHRERQLPGGLPGRPDRGQGQLGQRGLRGQRRRLRRAVRADPDHRR
nr:hypothetical protein GCM10020092_096870 [Actinoplanes digitatis]